MKELILICAHCPRPYSEYKDKIDNLVNFILS